MILKQRLKLIAVCLFITAPNAGFCQTTASLVAPLPSAIGMIANVPAQLDVKDVANPLAMQKFNDADLWQRATCTQMRSSRHWIRVF